MGLAVQSSGPKRHPLAGTSIDYSYKSSDRNNILYISSFPDVITHANLGEDRLRGFSVDMDRILGFCRRHYNTRTTVWMCYTILY